MCPSHIEAPDKSSQADDGDESDTGPVELWDPYTGLKPSELYGEASDGMLSFASKTTFIDRSNLICVTVLGVV